MRPDPRACLFLLLCGAIAGWFVAQLIPSELRGGVPDLFRQEYGRAREVGRDYEITESNWLPIPRLFADFDMTMDVELGEHTELDVLLHQVEPRRIDSETLPFHGRFAVLRLSSERAGQPWRTREQALFEPRSGGVEVAPGLDSTVSIHARGRELRANVAGRSLPPFESADDYGWMTLLVHGGKAVVKEIRIVPLGLPAAWRWATSTWVALGAGVGGLGALLALCLGLTWQQIGRMAIVQFGAPAAAAWWWIRQTGGAPMDPLRLPDPQALGSLLLWPALAPFGFVLLRGRLALLGAAVLVAAGSLHFATQPLRDALRTDEARLDAVFGPAAGSTLAEALGQRVRGPAEIHDVAPNPRRVFLLGGQLLYDRGAPTEHLERLLAGELRTKLLQKVDVPCLPTADGHTRQQWELFSRFFRGYRPAVLVFGVPRDEAARGRDGAPRSSPQALAATLTEVQKYCVEQSAKLVLFADQDLPEDLLAVLQKAAAADVPLVVGKAGETPGELAARLAAGIAPLLPKDAAK